MILELFGEFVVMLSSLFELIFKCYDLSSVLKHIFLHFVENDVLHSE